MIIVKRGPMSTPKRLRLGVHTALHRVMRTCLNWYWKLGPAFTNNKGRNLPAPSSPTRVTADPDDGTAALSLRTTSDQVSSDSDSFREDVADSDIDTASRDSITCLHTDEGTIWTTRKNYWKRVWASCRFSKGSHWTEAQLKRIGKSHQAMCGQDHESLQVEWDCAPMEECNCIGWWSGLTNCSALQWAPMPKFASETQRPKAMAGQRLWYCDWNNTMATITISKKREWLGPL